MTRSRAPSQAAPVPPTPRAPLADPAAAEVTKTPAAGALATPAAPVGTPAAGTLAAGTPAAGTPAAGTPAATETTLVPAAGPSGPAAGAAHPAGPDPTLAQWWRRLLAFVIDSLIITLATGALWGRLLASFANRMSAALSAYPNDSTRAAQAAYDRVFTQTIGPYLTVLIPTIILAITYYWLLTGYWGTTIGKRCLGTWVVTVSDRSRVSLRTSFLRALTFVLGGEVIPLFFLVDNLWLTWDRRRQALHDKAARTVVVRRPPQMN